MATETEQTQSQKGSRGGVGRRMAKRALEPVVATAVTAASAYLARKGAELARERLLPKLQQKGGATAVAKETLETVTEKVETVAEKVTPGEPSDEGGREKERKQREQRRNQRRKTLEQSGSS
jgi:hypothetical protein